METLDRAGRIATLALGTAACAVLYLVDPASLTAGTLCPFRALTGYQCPLCGGLRSTNNLLHGDLRTAFELNPLYVIALPGILYAAASIGRVAAGGTPLPMPRYTPAWGWAMGIVVGSFWLLRNLV